MTMPSWRMEEGIHPADGFDASCDATPGQRVLVPVFEVGGWRPGCNVISQKIMKKFDILYAMSPFDVALPQTGISDVVEGGKSTADTLLSEASANGAVGLPESANKSYGPLAQKSICGATPAMGLFPLCSACCHDDCDLASAATVPTRAFHESPLWTGRSWWIRTIPALQSDAQRGGDPTDFVADMDMTEATDSAHIPEPASLRYKVSEAMSEAHWSVSSLKGNKHTPNKDRAVSASLGAGAVQLLAVFEGHGDSGHVIADVSGEILPKLLLQRLAQVGTSFPCADSDAKAGWLKASSNAFVDLQMFFEGTASSQHDGDGSTNPGTLDARDSGTTATLVLLFPQQRALVAHVGHSRAILATRPRDDWSAPWSVTELTQDHKPDLPAERARIERAGAQVGTFNSYDPSPRVFTPGQTWPSIALSRCLGDLHAHTQGVTAVPETSFFDSLYDPSTEEAVLIICSDGVWDVMDAATVVKFAVVPQGITLEPAFAVACEAYARWSDLGHEQDYIDDITVVVKFLYTPWARV